MTKFNSNNNDKAKSTFCRKNAGIEGLCVLGFLILCLIAFAPAADAGCACNAGNWDPSGFLNSELGTSQPQSASSQSSSAGNSVSTTQIPVDRTKSFPNGQTFKSMKSVSSSDVVLDVSNGESYAKSHIEGAIHIPTKDFLDGEGNLKANEDLAKVLGDAGVSRDNSVVIYGTSESSGEAEFALLVLSYLGQKDVKLLDGNLADWQRASLPVESSENKKPVSEYKPEVKPEVIAQYDYVKSGQAQILDVRPFVDFGKGRIPGSSALDASNVLKGDKIKNGDDLGMVFSRLIKDQPIVVYSSDYSKSSLVWYALQLMGYKASIYTWEDWKAHEATGAKAGTVPAGGAAASSKYTKLGSK